MSKHRISLALVAVLISVPALAAAPQGHRFANGQCYYGQPAAATSNARVIDVSAAKYVNVAYGDTVAFKNGDKQFVWTFNGMDRVAVKLEMIAPSDFGRGEFTVYVPSDPLHRW
ncbi:hypothetical protein RHDC3_02370 [Rhodocyclaceae bacterium]|nr:hypothetical protein RHDC3_02370 [Rhodocyclaceae bacterium]